MLVGDAQLRRAARGNRRAHPRGEGPDHARGRACGRGKDRLAGEVPPNWTSFREFWKMFYDEARWWWPRTYAKVGGRARLRLPPHDPDDPPSRGRGLPRLLHQLEFPAAHRHDCKYMDEYEADGLLINSIKSCNSSGRPAARYCCARCEKRTGKPGRASSSPTWWHPRLLSAANIKYRLRAISR